MFDNNEYINSLFSGIPSTTTTEQKEEQTSYGSQTDFLSSSQSETYNPFEKDDYSTTQNFREQQTYDSSTPNFFAEQKETRKTTFAEAPLIQKSEQAVSLTKSQSKIRFETRMKTVLAVFCVIVACLLFVSVFNFVKASKIEAGFSDKQAQINTLNASITQQSKTYSEYTSIAKLEEWAENKKYKHINEITKVIELGEMYEEPVIEEIPSNWFNDVCEFFSKLFA